MQTEKAITKELKSLHCVKPNKNWVFSTKQAIFENEPAPVSWMFIPMGKPALAFSSFALVAFIFVSTFVLILPQKMPLRTYENFQALVSKFASEGNANKEAVLALQEIESQLKTISGSLANLKTLPNKAQALTMAEVVKSTAKTNEEAIVNIKNQNSSLSKNVLASLADVQDISKEIEEKTTALQKEMLEQFLSDLAQRDLLGENLVNFNKAQNYYQNGKLSEAMIFAVKINP